MTETKHHYPQLVQECVEFCEMFPNLQFKQIQSFFMDNYHNQELNTLKFKNSLRLGWFKVNNYSNNLTY